MCGYLPVWAPTTHCCVFALGLPLLAVWGPPCHRLVPRPGGIRQQLAATVPLVERLLLGIREAAPELGGRIMSELADEVDCVGASVTTAVFAAVLAVQLVDSCCLCRAAVFAVLLVDSCCFCSAAVFAVLLLIGTMLQSCRWLAIATQHALHSLSMYDTVAFCLAPPVSTATLHNLASYPSHLTPPQQHGKATS